MAVTTKSLYTETLINFTQSALNRLDKAVYLYDPSWEPSSLKDDRDTLPVVYLSVIKEEIKHHSQISKKRIILFESSQRKPTMLEDSFRQSVINVTSDNAVNDPIIHSLECLVPRDAVSRAIPALLNDINVVSQGINMGIGNYTEQQNTPLLDSVKTILMLYNTQISVVTKTIDLLKKFYGGSSDYARRSLQYMWRNRSRLKYKSWSTWETKDVVIADMNISKVGTEDDYYRVNIDLQEVPVLFIGQIPLGTLPATQPPAIVGKTIKAAFTKVMAMTNLGRTS